MSPFQTQIMKRIFQIIAAFAILTSCSKSQVEGVWSVTSANLDGQEELHGPARLIDFDGEQLVMITIGDLSTGEKGKILYDTSSYKEANDKLLIDNVEYGYGYFGDSMTISFFPDTSEFLVLRRLPEYLKRPDLNTDHFKGSFVIKGENYQDSVFFINDSTLIYTGHSNQRHPVRGWQTFNYKGWNFFHEHFELYPALLIDYCTEEKIQLINLFHNDYRTQLIPNNKGIDKASLTGSWSTYLERLRVPPPPQYGEPKLDEFTVRAMIKPDSISITRYGTTNSYSWDLTSDGKRIYFNESLFESYPSWKVLDLTDTTLTVNTGRQMLPDVEFEKLVFHRSKTAIDTKSEK